MTKMGNGTMGRWGAYLFGRERRLCREFSGVTSALSSTVVGGDASLDADRRLVSLDFTTATLTPLRDSFFLSLSPFLFRII